TCSKGGRCVFDKEFRCACRSCRFQKCIQSGMNAKAIKWPTSSKRASTSSFSGLEIGTDLSDSPLISQRVHEPPRTIANFSEINYCGEISNLLAKESRILSIRKKLSLFTSRKMEEILEMPSLIGSTDPSLRLRERSDYLTQQYSVNPIKYWMISDLHLIIEYCKSFPVFNQLTQMDMMVLLSHMGGLQMILTQSYYSAKNGHGTNTFPDGTIAIKEIDNNSRCSSALRRTVDTPWVDQLFSQPVQLMVDLNLSDASYALLRAVALFSPVADELSPEGRRMISTERERLADLLTRTLFREHGSGAPMKLVEMQSMLQTMYRLDERRRAQFVYFSVVSKDSQLSALGRAVYLREKRNTITISK
ncbi:hypothetical protein PMAYCL1PPCAC_26518, partial [Pristionchus mayeri]